MQPPIASPWGEPRPSASISGRLEWDEAQKCVCLYFLTPFAARLRCEFVVARYKPYGLIAFLYFPLLLLALWFTQLVKSKERPDKFLVHPWGCEEHYGFQSSRVAWKDVARVTERDGDVFVLRKRFYTGSYFIAHEDFADATQRARLAEIIESLRASNGANWEEVARQFRT